jgi:hypothetical protein
MSPIPADGWTVSVNMLPTERVIEIVETYRRMAEALIEIGSAFVYEGSHTYCLHCEMPVEIGCGKRCPGLIARRAGGVA